MLGEGRGIVAHFKLQGKVHVEGGSLSKGFGVFGGTVAGSKDLIEFVKNKSRSYLLSTAHPPAIVAANNAAISVVETEPQHYKNLWINTNYFKEKLDNLGFNTGRSCTPIIPLIIGNPGPAQEMADILFREEGIYGTPIVFPMVARELSRIRVQMNALLTREDLDMALTAIEKVGKKLKIISTSENKVHFVAYFTQDTLNKEKIYALTEISNFVKDEIWQYVNGEDVKTVQLTKNMPCPCQSGKKFKRCCFNRLKS